MELKCFENSIEGWNLKIFWSKIDKNSSIFGKINVLSIAVSLYRKVINAKTKIFCKSWKKLFEILFLITNEKIKANTKMILVNIKFQSKNREGLVKMITNSIIAK